MTPSFPPFLNPLMKWGIVQVQNMGNYFSNSFQFEDVPLLVLENIVHFLPLIDVLSFRLVNRSSYDACEQPHFKQLSSFNCMVLFQRLFENNQSSDVISATVDSTKNHFVCYQKFIINNLLILIRHCFVQDKYCIVELDTKSKKFNILQCDNYAEYCLERYFNCVYPKPALVNVFHPTSFCCYIDTNANKIYTIDYDQNTIYKSIFDYQGNELAKFVSQRFDFYFCFNGGLCLSQFSGTPFSVCGFGSVILVMWLQSDINILIRPFGGYNLTLVSSYLLPFNNNRVYFVLNLIFKSHLLSIDPNDIYSIKHHLTFKTTSNDNCAYELLDHETFFTNDKKLMRIDPVGHQRFLHQHWVSISKLNFIKN